MSEKSMATRIANRIIEGKAIVFLDQYKNPYISFSGNGNEVSEINSSECGNYIVKTGMDFLKVVPSKATVNQTIQALEAEARFGKKRQQHNLDVSIVPYKKDDILYDLGSGAIRITNKKWSRVKNPPIVFKKPPQQLQQVNPKRGGDMRLALKYVNITNESEQLLYLCWLVSVFVPTIQHPILILFGTHGSGKTTPMKFDKSLVDHTALNSGFNVPKNEQDLAVNAMHNYMLYYDNLSSISDSLSDIFSRAVTGSSWSVRKLYTNSELSTAEFQRAIILNGIPQVVSKPDLLDRSLPIQLERIGSNKKQPGVLKAEFEADKPYILGAIFDTLVKIKQIESKIKLKEAPSRMIEFDNLGCLIAEVLGYGQDKYIEARNENISQQHDHAIEASPVAQAIISFMEDKKEWSGAMDKLYGLLEPIVERLYLTRNVSWPKDSARLGIALRKVAPNLLAKGILLDFSRPGERIVTITKTTDATDGTDGKNG